MSTLAKSDSYYLLHIYEGVEARLGRKKKSYAAVLEEAKKLRRLDGEEDGLHVIRVTLKNGCASLAVKDFSNSELE